ncbi:MAG TPA: GTP cyclohydrolase FolE2 [Spirochaetota bacterium]|nr:GTP cyclohydrolase FolE2 [Spirochaetota bacterium]HOT18980.1 GTP cyclohydrolase FolE2 [Spirochaetota bacterium]
MPRKSLKDIQSQPDDRNLPINKVGVKDITYPVVVMDRADGLQHTVARINMYVDLPEHFRGTHMSRFVEVLNRYQGGISTKNVRNILDDLKGELNAKTAHVTIEFPYFIVKAAPVSGEKSMMDYLCILQGDSSVDYYTLQVKVPLLSVCPCSKEISRYGAHNQRNVVCVTVRAKEILWIEEFIEIVEHCGSSEIYALLKREDEKYITERSYENPVFVEDIVRNVAIKLLAHPKVLWFQVETESMESIHNHSAYAQIEIDKQKKGQR